MEHLITELRDWSFVLDKRKWSFSLPSGTIKTFAELENEGWELATSYTRATNVDFWIWKREKL